MSNTQGEPRQSLKTSIIGGAIAVVVAAGAIAGITVAADNARAQATQLHLLAGAKTSSITMQAATADDFAVSAQAVQAAAIAHTDELAAQQQAAYDAKVAAHKAALAKAAAEAAAAQAAQQAAAQQQVQQASGPSAPSGPPAASQSAGLPAGSPVPWIKSSDPNNSAGGSWDTQACASHNASGNPAICT